MPYDDAPQVAEKGITLLAFSARIYIKESIMVLYVVETNSGNKYRSYVHAGAERFATNNLSNIKYFYAFNMKEWDISTEIYRALGQEDGDALLAYWSWVKLREGAMYDETIQSERQYG